MGPKEYLDNVERQRYIADHAPDILCALIMRRASTDPHTLIDLTIKTASQLFDAVSPKGNNYQNGNTPNLRQILTEGQHAD